MNYRIRYGFLICALTSMFACATISKFDQYSYSQSTSLKVDALNLMSEATEPYEQHISEITALSTSIQKIYEYEKNKPKNQITEKMWSVIKDTSGNLYGGFMKRWRTEGKLDAVFVQEASILVGESFDQISQLESGKIKSSQVKN